MLVFSCTSCGKRLALAETWAGKKCRCSVCGQVLDVPLTSAAPLAIPVPSAPLTQNGAEGRSTAEASKRSDLPSTVDREADGAKPEASRRPTKDHSSADNQTVPPRSVSSLNSDALSSGPATISEDVDSELYDFLAPPEAADEVGRLGGYRILKILGSGGMGVVYQAEDVHLKRPVALKTMMPVLAASPANRKRFLLEARAAAAIEHDHIVTIYQVGEDRGVPFIAMQLLRGESLEQRILRGGPLDVAELLRVGRETASGLAVAHERGLIHRDIKPSNIWLEARDGSPRVKILDFGLARSLADDANLTGHGAILGTPAYMAPEQARGQTVDARADLFSLGCVLYRAATGQPPFRGADTIATLMAVAQHTPPSPHQVNPRLPLPVSQLILKLMAKDTEARPSSARTVVTAIERLEHGQTPSWTERSASALPKVIPVEPARPLVRAVPAAEDDDGTMRLEEGLPAPSSRPRILLPCLLGMAAGFLLLIALVAVGVVWWLYQPQPPATSPAIAETTAPEEKPDKRPEGAVLRAELQALVRDAVQKKSYDKTKIIGFPHAPEFEEVPPQGALLIGFELGIGKFITTDVINSVRAIYLTDKGEFLGEIHGKPTERLVTLKAKPGYAVGAVRLRTGLLIDGMEITFMRLQGKFLDLDDSYQESAGTLEKKGRELATLGGGGSLIVGICGKADERVCNAFGLVLRGKAAK